MKEFLVIIDSATGEIHIYNVSSDTDVDSQFIENLGFSISTVSWMFSTNVEIIRHEEIL